MAEEILSGVYRIGVPLPRNPLKELNCYIFKGEGRYLMVDTGMNREECIAAMNAGLQELGVDLKRTDFFITHLHADHSGLVGTLATESSRVYCSRPDGLAITRGGAWDQQKQFAMKSGFPEDQLEAAIQRHPGFRYNSRNQVDFTFVAEGDGVEIGEYHFRCVETPGHTRGHICLYDLEKGLLVSGDHILIDITPNVSLWSDEVNALQEYLDSLDKTYQLEIGLVLPGHRRRFTDCQGRIRELKRHHRARADEVVSILDNGPQNGYQVAAKMTWDIKCDSWEEFPVSQKWFATGEAIAHLKYLEGRGEITRETRDNQILYSRA